MTDYVVVKDGEEIARYQDDRKSADRHAADVEGEVVQQMMPLKGVWATWGKE